MKPKKLKQLNEEIRLLLEMHIEIPSIIVIKDGYIVAEQYYTDDFGPEHELVLAFTTRFAEGDDLH